jgi:pilus assembly protein CpaE
VNKTRADDGMLALLILESSSDSNPVRQALAQTGTPPIRLQCVERLQTALARIGGGGVDVILLDVTGENQEGSMDWLLQLIKGAPQVPVVVVCGAAHEALALKAMRAGAADYAIREQLGAGLARMVRSAVELARHKEPERRPNGGIVALMGAKGGVGTTTIALNIASILSLRSTVILAEMHPGFGTLAAHLQPHGLARNLSHLLSPGSLASADADAGTSLWTPKNIPGLRVLFGPQTPGECGAIDPERATAITQSLARMAHYVILDLPSSLSGANRAVIKHSSSLALVVERDPVCVRCARTMAEEMESWIGVPQPIGVIIVNRSPVSCPMPLTEINTLLGCRPLAVIPPSADVCLSAQNAGAPLVVSDPESLVAGSLGGLADTLAPEHSKPEPKNFRRERR